MLAASNRADSLDPKDFLAVRPLPNDSHRGLKITSRDATHYTCEKPTRKLVRELNYSRRLEQMRSCGYRSLNYRPYKELEGVELSERALALSAVGQNKDGETEREKDLMVPICGGGAEEATADLPDELAKIGKPTLYRGGPVRTPMIGGRMESLQDHTKLAKVRLKDVKRGHDLFQHIKEEDKRRQELSQEEARREMEVLRSEWKPGAFDERDGFGTTSPSHVSVAKKLSHSESDSPDESDQDHSKSSSGTELFVTQNVPDEGWNSQSNFSPSFGSKQASNPELNFRLQSSQFSVESAQEDKDSLYRYLRSVQWILEAMLQGSPAYMPSITASWGKGRDVLRDIKGREGFEMKKKTDDDWDKWTANQKTHVRSSMSAKSHDKQEMGKSLHGGDVKMLTSSASLLANNTNNAAMDADHDDIYEQTIEHVSSSVYLSDVGDEEILPRESSAVNEARSKALKQPFKSARFRAESAPIRSLKPPSITPRMTQWSKWKPMYSKRSQEGRKPQRPQSSPPMRKRLTGKQYEDLVKLIQKPDSVDRKIISDMKKESTKPSRPGSSVEVENLIRNFNKTKWQSEFTTVIKDQELVIHEQLSAMQRDRYQACCQKFMALGHLPDGGKFWEDIETMRSGVVTETASMAMRKLLMNYHWYTDLVNELPIEARDDIKCRATIDRLEQLSKQFGRFGPLRLSKERLLFVLGSFRPWERDAPDVKKAIEFVRTSVVYVSNEEYDEFLDAKGRREGTGQF
eukprot:m.34131 g.34131  ORF g.34131 m.34131 type:complete len:745 (+) comp31949_c0_seq3:130-2364(+)